MRDDNQQSRLLHELCVLLLATLGSLPPPSPQRPPVGFASFLLGASVTMLLCGSMTFLIGFLLLPWAIGLLVMLYLVGVVSDLSGLGRAVLCRISPLEPRGDVRSTIFQAANFLDVKSHRL